MKNITIRESFDWVYLEDNERNSLSNSEWEHLFRFLEQKYKNENVVEIGIRKLRFINLVGVIQLKTVRIEILPKLNIHHENTVQNRRSLLNMLSLTKRLPVLLNERTLSDFEKVDLSHVLAHLFIIELFKALKRGLYREYNLKSDNLKHLKGRLLVSQHIRKNAYQSVNAYCEYDELSPNVPLNQVLKAGLKVIYPFVQHSLLKTQMYMILEMFDEVSDVYITSSLIDGIQINRQNQHFEPVLQLAIALIKSNSMNTGVNNQIGYSFLFKMNDLYEGYIGECLKMVLASTSYKLDLQHKEKRLLINVHSGRENILLKPDFVVSRMEQNEPLPFFIMDTKWKSVIVNSHLNYNQGDIYQMYAYITAYKSAEKCIILYPRINEEILLPKWLIPDSNPNKYIEVHTIRLETVQNTMEDLERLILKQ